MGQQKPIFTPEYLRKAKELLNAFFRRRRDEPLEEALVGARLPHNPKPLSGRAAEPLP